VVLEGDEVGGRAQGDRPEGADGLQTVEDVSLGEFPEHIFKKSAAELIHDPTGDAEGAHLDLLGAGGIMPDQIDEWKWLAYASIKVEDRLRQMAMRIKDLDKEEKELLRRVTAPTEKVLEAHERIKEALQEFRQIHDVFQNSFDFKLKASWTDYVSSN